MPGRRLAIRWILRILSFMLISRSRTLGALACLFVLLAPVWALSALGQQRPVFRSGSSDFADENPLNQLRQRLQQGTAAGTTVAMEGAVDPDEYTVGPGDIFMVSIGGAQPAAIAVPVSADGRLILPDGEVIPADVRTLREVREDAIDALRLRYRNVAVDVSLAQPRQFFVHVSGAVPVPGRFLALPMSRVSDLLQLAFADTTAAPVSNDAYRPSLRNVLLKRRDGNEVTVDIARYLSTGEKDANPYVRDGDVINVPAYKVAERAVFVNGAVPFPGAYDHRPDDTLLDLLNVAGFNGSDGAIETVRLARRQPDGSFASTAYDATNLEAEAASVLLRPLDNISVDPVRRLSGTVEVEGFVQFPGQYAIEPGETTLQELVALAGGVRDDALVRAAYLERNVLPNPEPPLSRQNRFEARMLNLSALKADTLAIMQYLRQSDLDFISRTQFAQGLRIQNRVSVDLEEALAGNTPPVFLQDGDRLVVPHDRRSVFVFGHVERPGFITYSDARSVDEYIAMAGGRNTLGQRAYVVEATTGRYLDARSAPVYSGDMIFVDSRRDLADTAELQRLVLEENRARSQERTQWIQAATQTVFALASLISIYVTLQNR